MRAGTGPELTFRASDGQITGWAGTVLSGGGALTFLVHEHGVAALRGATGLALLALVIWANLIRPRIEISGHTITLVNPFAEITIPAEAVTRVSVRKFVTLNVEARRYAGVSIGHSTRSLVRGEADRARGLHLDPDRPPVVENYAAYVQERLEQVVDAAHAEALGEPAAVTRSWALLPCAGAAVLTVALVVVALI
ncbi:MAG: hypothetical protein JWP74_311 [Marmoricola sp.]|nr:hypothetical protein [Marmoricola sp.]